jgi:site-specific DNA-adenine methylase
MVESLPPIINYPGGKRQVAKKIIDEFPKEYKEYTELFVGGGSVYFKETKAKKRTINDKDDELIDFYKNFSKQACSKTLQCSADVDKDEYKDICSKKNKTVCDVIVGHTKSFIGACGMGYSYNEKKLTNVKKHCQDYKDKLNDTTILNQDWNVVFKKHCKNSDQVCYLDPPYTKKTFEYNTETNIKPEQIAHEMKNTNAKVILSYNNTPEVRKAFKGNNFKIKKLDFCYGMATKKGGTCKHTKELLIKNF